MFKLERLERAIIIFFIVAIFTATAAISYRKHHSAVTVEIGRFDFEPEVKEKININDATVNELMRLKRIGKLLAERIADHRSQKGLFISIDDIKNVKGIGKALFENIKDDITVE